MGLFVLGWWHFYHRGACAWGAVAFQATHQPWTNWENPVHLPSLCSYLYCVAVCCFYPASLWYQPGRCKPKQCEPCKWNNLETRFGRRKNSRPALLLWLLAASPRVRTAPSSAMGRESPALAGAPCRKWWHRRKRPRTRGGKGTVRSVRCACSHCHHQGPWNRVPGPPAVLGHFVWLVCGVFSSPFTALTASPDPIKHCGVCLCKFSCSFVFPPFLFFLVIPVN